jgi:hypothetical protein
LQVHKLVVILKEDGTEAVVEANKWWDLQQQYRKSCDKEIQAALLDTMNAMRQSQPGSLVLKREAVTVVGKETCVVRNPQMDDDIVTLDLAADETAKTQQVDSGIRCTFIIDIYVYCNQKSKLQMAGPGRFRLQGIEREWPWQAPSYHPFSCHLIMGSINSTTTPAQ